ncbi:glycine betaine uptake BCCT transporter [Halobacillus litoralis]|uniref:Glycine/betaine ABC transporter permease n=1 Tax=Halobacillus litoralis TaxID=45668 RepID=A0A410MBN5_9BACI|nr:BCCT family transporter [Halobacillus litoralis]QAS52093.1 glycine/betaine ABC transporter permease [Halobacillus litoralis]
MKKVTSVFWITLAITLFSVSWGSIAPKNLEKITMNIQSYISVHFGWYYLLIVTLFVVFCIYMIFSPYGKMKLGQPEDKPDYSYSTWFAMLFSAGMGIGLVFYGAAAPIQQYISNPPLAEPGTPEALADAMRITFFHYGIHAWGIYAIVALVLAYFKFRRGAPGLISATLEPIFGNKMKGPWGTLVDVISVFATIVGVATTLGFGAAQINGGITYLTNIDKGFWVQLIIIIIVTVLFMISAYTGLSKGIKYLSNANMGLAVTLFTIMLVIGPTLYIMNMLIDSLGAYLYTLPKESLRVAPNNEEQQTWIKNWTVFFWAWWIAWSPFVGIFIARVSKGRTIREFLSGVLLVPSAVSFLWFSAFGSSAIVKQDEGAELASLPPEQMLFGVFDQYPLGMLLSIIAMLLIATFFITSADSATFVLGMQTTNGSLNPPKAVKFAWGFAQSATAAVLLYTGGLQALQNALISAAFPFSFIMLLMVYSLYKALREDKAKLDQASGK